LPAVLNYCIVFLTAKITGISITNCLPMLSFPTNWHKVKTCLLSLQIFEVINATFHDTTCIIRLLSDIGNI